FILEQIHGAWRFRWTAMLVAWIVCLLGWLVVLAMPDTYSAWARVYVDTRTRLSQVTQGLAVDSNMASQAAAVRQALLGGPQLEKVARLAMPGYAGASPERQATIIDGLRKRLQVEASGERNQPADLYMITYTARDRRTAHRVVDQLLRLFLANSLGGSLQGSEQAQAFLTQQIAEYDSKLASAESRLADFKRQNAGLVPGATGDYFTHLHAETDNLDKDRLALTVAEQKRDELHRTLSSERPGGEPRLPGYQAAVEPGGGRSCRSAAPGRRSGGQDRRAAQDDQHRSPGRGGVRAPQSRLRRDPGPVSGPGGASQPGKARRQGGGERRGALRGRRSAHGERAAGLTRPHPAHPGGAARRPRRRRRRGLRDASAAAGVCFSASAHRGHAASSAGRGEHDLAGEAPGAGAPCRMGVLHGGCRIVCGGGNDAADAERHRALPARTDRMSVIENAIKRLQAARAGAAFARGTAGASGGA